MRNPKDRLTDMLEAIDNIERYAGRGRVAFEQDELIQNWFIHHIQIIGEAAAKIDRSFHLDHPQISWAQIIAMRNILVHDYFGIDLEAVWGVVERDLPELKRRIKEVIEYI
ncbi:MAG: HepT-like ribonuclease domain-containing protein [Desulfobacterales bacterium]